MFILKIILILYIILINIYSTLSQLFVEEKCLIKKVDVLFIIDSTANIGDNNHDLLRKFIIDVLNKMNNNEDNDDIYIAVTQFTPEEHFEFNLEVFNDRTEDMILVCFLILPEKTAVLLISYSICRKQ